MNWGHILKKELDFDLREQRIASYEKVTVEDVKKVFRNVFFNNPRRINMKIFSHAHRDMAEKRKESQKLNEEFYKNSELFGGNLTVETIDEVKPFQRTHSLHPHN